MRPSYFNTPLEVPTHSKASLAFAFELTVGKFEI